MIRMKKTIGAPKKADSTKLTYFPKQEPKWGQTPKTVTSYSSHGVAVVVEGPIPVDERNVVMNLNDYAENPQDLIGKVLNEKTTYDANDPKLKNMINQHSNKNLLLFFCKGCYELVSIKTLLDKGPFPDSSRNIDRYLNALSYRQIVGIGTEKELKTIKEEHHKKTSAR